MAKKTTPPKPQPQNPRPRTEFIRLDALEKAVPSEIKRVKTTRMYSTSPQIPAPTRNGPDNTNSEAKNKDK